MTTRTPSTTMGGKKASPRPFPPWRSAGHGSMGTLALAAGVAVVQETPVVNRFQDVDQGMMDDPVAVGRGAEKAFLGLVDIEGPIGTGLPGVLAQFLMQLPQSLFQVNVELQHRGVESLASFGLLRRLQEIREGNQL